MDQITNELRRCIREFREINRRKSMPLLYFFIEKYKQSTLGEIVRFSKNLEKILLQLRIHLPVYCQMDL